MKSISDLIVESSKNKIDIKLSLTNDQFYDILNAVYDLYYEKYYERDYKQNVAELYKVVWTAGKDANIEIDSDYSTDGNIKNTHLE